MNANEIKILKSLQHGRISLPLIIFYLCTMALNGLVLLFKSFNFWLPPFFCRTVIQPIDFSSSDIIYTHVLYHSNRTNFFNAKKENERKNINSYWSNANGRKSISRFLVINFFFWQPLCFCSTFWNNNLDLKMFLKVFTAAPSRFWECGSFLSISV